MTHDIKIPPYVFNRILAGDQSEVDLKPNWNFALGDYISFREFDPRSHSPTGRDTTREVTGVEEKHDTDELGGIVKFVTVTFGAAVKANGLPVSSE